MGGAGGNDHAARQGVPSLAPPAKRVTRTVSPTSTATDDRRHLCAARAVTQRRRTAASPPHHGSQGAG